MRSCIKKRLIAIGGSSKRYCSLKIQIITSKCKTNIYAKHSSRVKLLCSRKRRNFNTLISYWLIHHSPWLSNRHFRLSLRQMQESYLNQDYNCLAWPHLPSPHHQWPQNRWSSLAEMIKKIYLQNRPKVRLRERKEKRKLKKHQAFSYLFNSLAQSLWPID